MGSLLNSKSPGLDGLSYEVYVLLFPDMKEELLTVFNCILQRKRLMGSMGRGFIQLLPKVAGVPISCSITAPAPLYGGTEDPQVPLTPTAETASDPCPM